ncbi:MAG TPA: DUF2846 domain-containing protein [Aestuariivirgaceae bacterium]|jgi:hypothetical protein
MRTANLCLALSLMLSLLQGCAAEGDPFERQAGLSNEVGVIYVYRPLTSVIGRGEDPYVSIAGRNMGRLRAGGYVKLVVSIGEHKVTAHQSLFLLPSWPRSVEVAVASGGSAYVKVDQRITDVDFSGGASATQQIFIEEVSSTTGQSEIATLRENT